jgi:hypothetical protein
MKKRPITDYSIYLFLCLVLTGLLFVLTYNQAMHPGDQVMFKSDILAYMQDAMGIDSGYSYPYRLFFWCVRGLAFFMPVEVSIATVVAGLNLLALLAAKFYSDKLIVISADDKSYRTKHIFADLVIFCVFLLSMVVTPEGIHLPHKYNNYLGIFTGNPWHNATYTATRPFAIVAFFSFAKILKEYEANINKRDLVVFAVSLFLTTFTKPSFTLVLVSVAGLIMAFRLIKNKFKNLKNTLILALCFVPTFIDMLRQYGGVFAGTGDAATESGIGFCFFDVWKLMNIYIPEAVFYGNIFAIACLVAFAVNRSIKGDTLYKFALFFFLVSFLEAGLLCEKGFRFQDFNFCWGYMHGIFFFELVSAVKLLQETFKKKLKWYALLITYGAFSIQLLSGIYYFVNIFRGFTYE